MSGITEVRSCESLANGLAALGSQRAQGPEVDIDQQIRAAQEAVRALQINLGLASGGSPGEGASELFQQSKAAGLFAPGLPGNGGSLSPDAGQLRAQYQRQGVGSATLLDVTQELAQSKGHVSVHSDTVDPWPHDAQPRSCLSLTMSPIQPKALQLSPPPPPSNFTQTVPVFSPADVPLAGDMHSKNAEETQAASKTAPPAPPISPVPSVKPAGPKVPPPIVAVPSEPSLPAIPKADSSKVPEPVSKASSGAGSSDATDVYADGIYWKLNRYFKPNKSGKIAGSKEALAMFRDKNQRGKLAEILKREGSLNAMELKVKELRSQQSEEILEGGWHTTVSLKALGWTEQMINSSYQWALARNLVRKNEVHQADEWRIPTRSTYVFTDRTLHQTEGSAQMEMEDPEGTLLTGAADNTAEVLMLRGGSAASAAASQSAQSAATAKVQGLPMVQQNGDPFSYISNFIDQMGKKLDRVAEFEDKLRSFKTARSEEMLKQIDTKKLQYQSTYDKLLNFQQTSCDLMSPTVEKQQELRQLFVECTKVDVSMNNIMSRARALKPAAKAKTAAKAAAKAKAGSVKEAASAEDGPASRKRNSSGTGGSAKKKAKAKAKANAAK